MQRERATQNPIFLECDRTTRNQMPQIMGGIGGAMSFGLVSLSGSGGMGGGMGGGGVGGGMGGRSMGGVTMHYGVARMGGGVGGGMGGGMGNMGGAGASSARGFGNPLINKFASFLFDVYSMLLKYFFYSSLPTLPTPTLSENSSRNATTAPKNANTLAEKWPTGATLPSQVLLIGAEFDNQLANVVNYDDELGLFEVRLALQDKVLKVELKELRVVGVKVTVTGLQVRSEHNGCTGVIRSFQGECVLADLDNGATNVVLRSNNIIFPVGTRIKIFGSESMPQLNGLYGVVMSVNDAEKSYQVSVKNDINVRIEFANATL
jgi:hypothetical protein